jgi:hypothetical protein
MRYCSIDIDFDVFKALTARRNSADTSENDVLRELLGLDASKASDGNGQSSAPASGVWTSEGVDFPVGTKLRHRFRGGRIVEARITAKGVEYDGTPHGGLSPAAAAASGHQANGWQFWQVETRSGWRKADSLRR